MTASRAHLTIRNLPADVSRAIEEERRKRGSSLNATVVHLLRVAVGAAPDEPFDNGLAKYAGGWTESELDEFERNTRETRAIDPEMWAAAPRTRRRAR